MGSKAENTRRVQELEEELSEEKLAELFNNFEEGGIDSVEQDRLESAEIKRSQVLVVVLAVCIVVSFIYLVFFGV